MQSELTFYGGAGTVTGANFMLKTGEVTVLLDCGLLHGEKYGQLKEFPYEPSEVDVLIVSHAHADHVGMIPKLVRDGFSGVIWSTPATKDISAVMLPDAQKILAQEAHERGEDPLYERQDIADALEIWQTAEYHEEFTVGDAKARFFDAGHILGSAFVEIERGGRTFVYTGDLGNTPAPLLRDTEPMEGAHYLVTESVYGDRNHEDREERTHKLAEAVSKIYKLGGTLLIPAFSLQRTQILMYEIAQLFASGTVPTMPVYLDSPLGSNVTEVFRRYTNLLNTNAQEAAQRGALFDHPSFVTVGGTQESDAAARQSGPKIIISSSGMSVGGRVLAHEERILRDKHNIILFVGYQAAHTLGRRIQEGNKTVRINDRSVRVRARVETIRGYSGHKDSEHLVEFAERASSTLEKVFVVLGEPKASLFLAQRLHDIVGLDAVVPEAGQTVTLNF